MFSALAPVSGSAVRCAPTPQRARSVIRASASSTWALVGGALVSAGGGLLGIITGAAIRGTTVVIPRPLPSLLRVNLSAPDRRVTGSLA